MNCGFEEIMQNVWILIQFTAEEVEEEELEKIKKRFSQTIILIRVIRIVISVSEFSASRRVVIWHPEN